MEQLIRVGMDTSKSVFQLHGVDASERPALVRRLRRRAVLPFFAKLAPVRIGLEACGGAHHWVRELTALGHEVVLIAPQHAKPYVRRGKHDAADAEAICEVMSRPRTRFVATSRAGWRLPRRRQGRAPPMARWPAASLDRVSARRRHVLKAATGDIGTQVLAREGRWRDRSIRDARNSEGSIGQRKLPA